MLYISRRIGNTQYGVVDTDDMVEEAVDMSTLQDLYLNKGITIFGLNAVQRKATVYQPVNMRSKQQVKMKMLRHVDVKVYQSFITSIVLDSAQITKPVDIVLSKFGSIIADRVFEGNQNVGEHKATVYLDDTLTWRADAFWCGHDFSGTFIGIGDKRYGYGVVVDCSSVKNDELVWFLYRALYDDSRSRVNWVSNSIRDVSDRKCYMLDLLKEDEFRSWDDILNGRHPTWEKR